ncbi:FtsK/SpoIIIE domain-containing protein [Neomoorella mulderi]|uniref:DNA translocase FtsK n=1 Tax=Moorella mulderi DSM 14980 TaxID=1122241 RepID=A0A151ASR6_9FIRM|nr:FtsK/SpoIIIE domain-containing protein [Moorella mulderi]KYH30632.1 DNA translocase FtsK [Moorella mulderi DSM 14980]
MQLERNQLVAGALVERLTKAKVGVVVKGLNGIDPIVISKLAGETLGKLLAVCVVGYGRISEETDGITFSNNLESAVDWRNTPDIAGRIVVFIRDDIPKLHSLGDLDTLTERDVTEHLLTLAEEKLADNIPRGNFWKALHAESATFPLNLVEDFVKAVFSEKENQDAIINNLWRLGLLRDDQLFKHNQDAQKRLVRNRELLVEIGLMSDESRKRLTRVLAKAMGDRRDHLRKAFLDLQQFYRTRDFSVLKRLDVETVEELIKAGKAPKTQEVQSGCKKQGNDNSEDQSKYEQILKGRRAVEAISQCLVKGDEDAEKTLKYVADAIKNKIKNPQEAGDTVIIETRDGSQTIKLEVPPLELRTLVKLACSDTAWGGTLITPRLGLKEAVYHFNPEEFKPYDPADPSQGIGDQCLFSLLRNFDVTLPSGERFSPIIDRLIQARRSLINEIDLLLSHPFVLLGGSADLRRLVNEYLDAFAGVLRLCRQHEATLHAHDPEALRMAITELLRLDVIYVKTPTEWKALLTPLNPFHLWRYREILNAVFSENRDLTEEEQEQLAAALPDLPHLVHFLVVSPLVTGNQTLVLPQAGSLETLPTFENDTNRYLGSDGVEFLPEAMRRFLAVTPYARTQMRVAVVDLPDLKAALSQTAEFIRSSQCDQVVLDVYSTRGQNSVGELGRLDYEDSDYKVAELLRNGKLVVQIHSCKSLTEVTEALKAKPVHVAMFFDQSRYHIGHAPRARQLLVSPLVITYQYEYSDSFKRGIIAPSSEAEDGLFADWHFLIQRAALLPAGQQLRLQYDQGVDLEPINNLLAIGATRWLVVADRLLTPYAPKGAIPLGERRYGQREIAVWARANSRVVDQLVDLLRRYNLLPNVETVADLVHRFGHIASDGLLSLPGSGGDARTREKREKAFLGTVLAAAWYTSKYPGALIASLDSNLARLWLKGRLGGDKRADLIGLRVEGDQRLIVEPIEVKTHDDDDVVNVERDDVGNVSFTGPAIQQLQSTLAILQSIFGGSDNQPLLTPARREVLKYQLHRECFRDIHHHDWKRTWYQRLRDAFAVNPRISIQCHGMVVHVKLDNKSGTDVYHDSSGFVSLVSIGNRTIQSLVAPPTAVWSDSELNHGQEQNTKSDTVERAVDKEPRDQEALYNSCITTEPQLIVKEDFRIVETNDKRPSGNISNVDRSEAEELARLFRRACQSYRIQLQDCDPARAVMGPSVWRFYVRLARGQRLDALRNALEDIGREMCRSGLLISTLPLSDEIALDIPRGQRERVPLIRGLECLPPISSIEKMPIPIGVTPEGQDIIRDLGEMPHLLVGGTTGAGKTRFLYGILVALIKTHPDPSSLRILL